MPRGRSRATRLSKRWLGFSSGTAFLAQGAGSVGTVVASPTSVLDTIMRTRGSVVSFVDGVDEPGALSEIAIGMIILQEGSIAVGGFPIPITDDNADWFWYTRFTLGYEEPVLNVISVQTVSGYREVIDSKAMRKGALDTEIGLCFEQVSLGTDVGSNTVVNGRWLLGQ